MKGVLNNEGKLEAGGAGAEPARVTTFMLDIEANGRMAIEQRGGHVATRARH